MVPKTPVCPLQRRINTVLIAPAILMQRQSVEVVRGSRFNLLEFFYLRAKFWQVVFTKLIGINYGIKN